MKIALLTTDYFSLHYDMLVTALRSEVGSVELITLTEKQQDNLKKFMPTRDWNARYDRIILHLDPQKLYEQNQFLRVYDNLCLLRTDVDDEKTNSAICQLLTALPWLRWLGMSVAFGDKIAQAGFDAQIIPPIHDVGYYRRHQQQHAQSYCYVYDETSAVSVDMALDEAIENVVVLGEYHASQSMYQNIQAKDFFIFCPQMDNYNPLPMIKAMANGAVVLTLNPGQRLCKHYGWQDNENCIFIRDYETVLETIQILSDHHDMVDEISQGAMKSVDLFTQSSVGRHIGQCLTVPTRDKDGYQFRVKLFGFEL